MKSPLLKWLIGGALVLGCPLGVFCFISSGSLIKGILSVVTVVLIVLLACRREIMSEYIEKNITT